MHVPKITTPLFVRVDCQAHSRYRSPEGVYQVNVPQDCHVIQQASTAVRLVRENAAFMNENADKACVRVFSAEGHEISVPLLMEDPEDDEMDASFCGRAIDFPEHITIQ